LPSAVPLVIVVRTESDTWLNDLVKELNTEVPSYINVINKGNVIDSLMFQGLLIEHMQSNILGILVMADKLCLQVQEGSGIRYFSFEILKVS
jgi:hypothetical protein